MSENNQAKIIAEFDLQIEQRLLSRRDAVRAAVKKGLGAISAPLAVAASANAAFGQSAQLPQQIVDVLNFALTLEELEAEFYNLGNKADNLIPKDARRTFEVLRDHENAHVKLLRGALGTRAVPKPQIDFTAGGQFADVFRNYQTFLTLSQAFEDTGVRAYKGQATNLMSAPTILQTALQIHSVEARHAAQVRRLRGEKGWITGGTSKVPAAAAAVYLKEENTVQGGIDFAGAGNTPLSAASETFDEPLTKTEVLAIVAPFLPGLGVKFELKQVKN